jgi:hypothetical protein
MDDEAKRAIALFRLGVLGPLVSARLEAVGADPERVAGAAMAARLAVQRPAGALRVDRRPRQRRSAVRFEPRLPAPSAFTPSSPQLLGDVQRERAPASLHPGWAAHLRRTSDG